MRDWIVLGDAPVLSRGKVGRGFGLCRAFYFIIALLASAAISTTGHAAQIYNLPLEVTSQQATGVIDPHALTMTFDRHYDSSTPIYVDITLTGANFGGTPTATFREFIVDAKNSNVGSLVPVSPTGCDVEISGTHLTIGAAGNCVAASGHNLAAVDISGITYSSNNLLTSTNHSITLTVAVGNPANSSTPYENSRTFTAVTIPGLTPITYSLYTFTAGNGLGSLNINPDGKVATSDAPTYVSGTVVTLTAIPNTAAGDYSWTFAGWSGACSGTAPTCQVTMTSDKTVTATFNTISYLRLGAVFSTSQNDSQSFLRFFNTGTHAGTVTVTLSDSTTGKLLGQWTSPSIPANASPQYSMGTIESSVTQGLTKPKYYSISVQSNITGYLQHVVWRPSEGSFSNLSTCGAGVTTNTDKLNNVHSSAIDYGYPSTVVVNNTGTTAEVTLGIYGASDGAKLGTYTTASIPFGGQSFIAMKTIENLLKITPGSVGNHYVIKAEGNFTGFLQHLVENVQAGVLLDMTTVCTLPPPS